MKDPVGVNLERELCLSCLEDPKQRWASGVGVWQLQSVLRAVLSFA